jgi:uracil-DNA glycosylase family 4
MRSLPLYTESDLPVVQTVEGLDRNPSCARCELYKSNPDGSRCLPADGLPGDILVIGEYPTEFERKLGRPFASAAGKLTRDLIKEFAPGRNVVYANAINCKPFSKDDDLDDAAEKCRGYLAKLIEEVQPKLILLMGPLAGQGFLGRSYQPLSVRGGYAWSRMVSGPVPVFLLASPYSCGRNRLYQKAFREDLEKVLSGKIALNTKVRSARYHIVETVEDAQAAYEVLKKEPFVATDVETSGMMFEPDFRIECLAVSGRTDVYVFTRECIEDAETALVLQRILCGLDHTSWNGQYDLCAIECEPRLVPRRDLKKTLLNLISDARLKRKLLDAEARGDLATCADLVGMGGHKDEQKGALQLVCGELRALAMATTLTPTGRARKAPKCLYVDPSKVPAKWLEWINDGFDEQKFAHRFVNKDIEHKYVALDALSTWQLEELLHSQLLDQEDLGQWTIWDEVTRPAMYAWCRARLNGFPTDKNAVKAFSEYLKTEADLVLKKIHAYKPGLNPQSPKQVGEYLSSLGLKSKRKTTSGAQSWAKDVLETMKDKHPIIPLLLKYTLLTHTDSNFAGGGLKDIRSDGRVHPSYLLDGTGSGRCSSQDPNFFNRLKGRDAESRELGNMLRACHQCPPGWTMIEADMGQIEIRVAADRSRDIAMVKMLCSGVDFHTQSSELFAKAMGMDFSKMSTEERDIFREKSKTCIAEGELVLTRRGLIPIENVDSRDLVWDGVDWVAHDGVMFMGYREVVTYDCLTATDDHEVYLQDGTKQPLGQVVTSGRRLTRSGDGEVPIRVSFSDGESLDLQVQSTAQASRVSVLSLQEDVPDLRDRHQTRADKELPMSKGCSLRRRSACKDSRDEILGNALPLQRSHQPDVCELRSARDRVQVQISRGVHTLGSGEPTAPNLSWCGHRQDQQLGSLRAGESASCPAQSESLQQAYQSPCSVSGAAGDSGPRLASDEVGPSGSDIRSGVHEQAPFSGNDPRGDSATTSRRQAKVYDIVNAGPRHRFTVSGRLVSNCNFAAIYEIPSQLGFMLSKRLKIDKDQGIQLGNSMFKIYKDLRTYMDRTYAEAWETGYARTHWKGQPARKRPLWGMGKNPPTLKELEKAINYDRGSDEETRMDLTDARATYNTDVQGSAVDIITSMLKPVVDWLDANTNGGQFLLQIYDSIMLMVRDEDLDKTLKFLLPLMRDESDVYAKQGYVDGIPLVADVKVGKSWATLKKVKV